MLAFGKRTTTDRKNTSPRPSALLDARLKTICWGSDTCLTRPVALREKTCACSPVLTASPPVPAEVISLIA